MIRFYALLIVFQLIALSGAAGQTTSTVSCGDYAIRSGEVVKVHLAFDKPPSVDGASLQVTAHGPDGTTNLIFGYARTKPETSQYEVPLRIPDTAVGGVWTVSGVRIYIEGREPYEVPFKGCTFPVIASIKPVLPANAAVSVNPSQTQFLRKEAVRVQSEVQQLKSAFQDRVSSNLAGSIPTLLRNKLNDSEKSLDATQLAFQKLGSSTDQQPHADIFFDDLRRGYKTAVSQLNSSAAVAAPLQGAQLLFVSNASLTPEPLLALALRPLERTELAFSTVADSSSLVFDLVVETSPPGATVSYYRQGDAPHPSPDVTKATIHGLAYAVWMVRVEMSGYRPAVREHDPFVEPNHVVHVDLEK
jgi:hypothetical protein